MSAADGRTPRAPVLALRTALAVFFLHTGGVLADDGGDDEPLSTVLPEVVVTAQKLEQTLEQVPVSVGTIDGALMQQSGAGGFPDLQGYLGNVTLALSPTGGDFFIRGFGTLSTNAGFEPSVGTVVDGVFYGRSNFLSVFFNDDERMEVLRGPQGTLFGKNSTAGVFNLVTRAPRNDTGIGGDLLLGSDQRAVRPVFNAAIGPNWSMRLSGNFSRDDGRLHNTELDRPEVDTAQNTVRGRLRYEADKLQIDLGAFYSKQWLNANNFQLIKVSAPTAALMRNYDPQFESNLDFGTSENVPSRGETQFEGANATLNYTLDGVAGIDRWKLTSVTGWAKQTLESRDIDGDFSPVPVVRDTLIKPAPYKQFSQELRIGGHDDNILGFGHGIDFVVGLYYFDSTFVSNDQYQLEDLGGALAFLTAATAGNPDGSPLLRLGGVPLAQLGYSLGQLVDTLQPLIDPLIGSEQVARVSLDQETSTAALFGQMEYFFVDDWAIILGGRIGHEHKQGRFASSHEGVFIPLVAGQQDFDSSISRSENEFSPKAGLKWQLLPNANAYLTWTRGYKSGGFNAMPLNPDHLEFNRERATSVELGAKARLLDGSMRISAALFDMRFDDLQVSTFVAGGGGGAAPVFLNAAAARSRGGELEINWLAPLRGLAFYGSAGYADAYYTHYPDAPACAVPSGCANTNADGMTQDLSGEPLSNAPRWTAAAVPSFTTIVPGGALATFAIDVLYRGERYVDVDLAPEKKQRATTELNARIVLGSRRGNWLLSLAARNLTKEKIVDQVLDEPLAPGNYAATRSDRGRVISANLILDI